MLAEKQKDNHATTDIAACQKETTAFLKMLRDSVSVM